MQIKYIYIDETNDHFQKLIDEINQNGGDATIQKEKVSRCTYVECDGNYIITRPDDGYLFSELASYSSSHEEGTFSIEECKKEIRKEIDDYFERLRKNYPCFDTWISAPSTYYIVLIHRGGDYDIEGYTKGLIDACFQNKKNLYGNLVLSMVSKTCNQTPYPRGFWNNGNFVFSPELKALPSEITTIMNRLGIPNPFIPQESEPAAAAGSPVIDNQNEDSADDKQTGNPSAQPKGSELSAAAGSPVIDNQNEDSADDGQTGNPSAQPKSFIIWIIIMSIVLAVLLAFLLYVFPSVIRFVPDEGEYVTETEVITMPVVLSGKKANYQIGWPAGISENDDTRTKKRKAGFSWTKTEAPKVIIDTKDVSLDEPYHYRRITRKAAPIQYFHLSMIFSFYVFCCVLVFIFFLKVFRFFSRQEQINREFGFSRTEKFIKKLQPDDQADIRKQFAKEAIHFFFSKDEA